MCGISGILTRSGTGAAALLDECQRHRGPDDTGHYRDPRNRAELRFRRLSILDLSQAGHQPMTNEDGTVWLVFNGEIYNHAALRAEMATKGHTFRSRTDSEVLVHLWEEHGRAMLSRLNGMFAFCIWDERSGEAFLARDHAGIKPLYVTDLVGGDVAFASEAKVLLQLPQVRRDVDPVALRQYLTFLWVPGERTMWQGIRKLPPAGWLSWSERGIERGTWWDWDQSYQEEMPAESWIESVRGTLVEAVDRQLMSDVPLGTLLSGGLDSSAIAGAMRVLRPTSPIRAYTAGVTGDEQDGFADDLPFAREVAAALQLELAEEPLDTSIASILPLLIWHSDEPLADPAIAASYLLCRRARHDGTVVLLSGQGADELYHGYRSHQAVRMASSLSGVPTRLVRAATAIGSAIAGQTGLSSRASPRRVLKMLRYLGATSGERILQLADWGSASIRDEILSPQVRAIDTGEVYGDYLALFEQSRAHTDEERWSYVLFKTFLPALNLTYGDRTSMAASVELRVPYLDRALIEQAGRIPVGLKYRDGRQKWILEEAARPWLPDSVLRRSKTGFGAPLRSWLSGEMMKQMRATLLGERFEARGLFRRQGVLTLLTDLETGRRDVAYIVWALFTFEMWARTFLDAPGVAPTSFAA